MLSATLIRDKLLYAPFHLLILNAKNIQWILDNIQNRWINTIDIKLIAYFLYDTVWNNLFQLFVDTKSAAYNQNLQFKMDQTCHQILK